MFFILFLLLDSVRGVLLYLLPSEKAVNKNANPYLEKLAEILRIGCNLFYIFFFYVLILYLWVLLFNSSLTEGELSHSRFQFLSIYLCVHLTSPTSESELNPSETQIRRNRSNHLLLQCCQYYMETNCRSFKLRCGLAIWKTEAIFWFKKNIVNMHRWTAERVGKVALAVWLLTGCE